MRDPFDAPRREGCLAHLLLAATAIIGTIALVAAARLVHLTKGH